MFLILAILISFDAIPINISCAFIPVAVCKKVGSKKSKPLYVEMFLDSFISLWTIFCIYMELLSPVILRIIYFVTFILFLSALCSIGVIVTDQLSLFAPSFFAASYSSPPGYQGVII